MASKTVLSLQAETALAEYLASFRDNPLGFVMAAYPWGEPTLADGSPNPLREKTGPEEWQRDILVALGEHIRENDGLHDMGIDRDVWKSATASGHGIGKSAIVCWLIQFFMSTRRNARGVVTANTQYQLESKTWPELAKWHSLLLNKHWFEWSATRYVFAAYPEEQRKNYCFDAQTVSPEKPEAFQGLHNEDSSITVIFDEASGIHPKLWEVAEGALTDGEGFFFAFGNPTQPEGAFADCFDKYKGLYRVRHVDSREVSFTNKKALQAIIDKYGEDSDEARVRVKGLFPRQAFNGYIPMEVVRDAQNRELFIDVGAPLIMAVDVARKGRDETVIGWRQGRDARSRTFKTYHGLDTVEVAERVAEEANRTRPDAIVIEGGSNLGVGVLDILKRQGYPVFEFYPGAHASKDSLYLNRRAEIWSEGLKWLQEEGCISDDETLAKQLTCVQYTYDKSEQKILIEPKEAIRSRGLPSPDRADTLILTFAVRPSRRDAARMRKKQNDGRLRDYDNDPTLY